MRARLAEDGPGASASLSSSSDETIRAVLGRLLPEVGASFADDYLYGTVLYAKWLFSVCAMFTFERGGGELSGVESELLLSCALVLALFIPVPGLWSLKCKPSGTSSLNSGVADSCIM